MDRWQIEKKIVLECIKNPKFKERLQTHPKAALQELFKDERWVNDSQIDHLKIVFHQENKNEFHIGIPHIEKALTEDQLRQVSAGAWGN